MLTKGTFSHRNSGSQTSDLNRDANCLKSVHTECIVLYWYLKLAIIWVLYKERNAVLCSHCPFNPHFRALRLESTFFCKQLFNSPFFSLESVLSLLLLSVLGVFIRLLRLLPPLPFLPSVNIHAANGRGNEAFVFACQCTLCFTALSHSTV